MNLRLAILELAAQHQLSAKDSARLTELAGVHRQPQRLMHYVPAGLAVVAAVLGGLGIIFWIAANWDTVTRATRFALLESFFVVMCIGALLRPAARVPLSLIAFLATGGLLAFFGQTYQSGADPWQLFAWWSALTLPLCVGVRHDALWTAWSIAAMTALTLWSHAQGGYEWTSAMPLSSHRILHWFGALLLTIALSPKFRKYTGAGIWSLRLCLLLAISVIAIGAVNNVFDASAPVQYFLGLVLIAGLFVAFCTAALFDTFALCALALSLNLLIDAGLVRSLGKSHSMGDSVLLTIGLLAAALLGATVKVILTLFRDHEVKEGVQ
jgi:uncharacterized membrane protein